MYKWISGTLAGWPLVGWYIRRPVSQGCSLSGADPRSAGSCCDRAQLSGRPAFWGGQGSASFSVMLSSVIAGGTGHADIYVCFRQKGGRTLRAMQKNGSGSKQLVVAVKGHRDCCRGRLKDPEFNLRSEHWVTNIMTQMSKFGRTNFRSPLNQNLNI